MRIYDGHTETVRVMSVDSPLAGSRVDEVVLDYGDLVGLLRMPDATIREWLEHMKTRFPPSPKGRK